jgi:diadenosine tetraphosphate (Ap4A) HIT family hydrolase
MLSDPKSVGWVLDPQIERDTTAIVDLPLCHVLLINDANYPWLLLVPRRKQIVELVNLDAIEQVQLMGEIAEAARALKAVTGCDKINIAALGNVVAQLHVHVIARFRNDAAWPKAVWGAVPARAYDEAARQQLIAALRRKLALAPLPVADR